MKYKETVDKTVNVIQSDYTTLYDLYTADRPCVIKVNAEGGNIGINLRVGDDSCGTLYMTNSTITTVANAKHLIAANSYGTNNAGSLTFLLDAGETLRFKCNAGAGNTDPKGIFKIHVYEWE